MRCSSIILFLLTLSSLTAAASGTRRIVAATFSCGEIAGTNYCQVVTRKDAELFPTWNPEKEECSLSMKEAIVLARERIKRRIPKVTEWDLISIRLSPLWDLDTWLYSISFQERGENKQTQDQIRIVVAPSGLVPTLQMTEVTVTTTRQGRNTQQVVVAQETRRANKVIRGSLVPALKNKDCD